MTSRWVESGRFVPRTTRDQSCVDPSGRGADLDRGPGRRRAGRRLMPSGVARRPLVRGRPRRPVRGGARSRRRVAADAGDDGRARELVRSRRRRPWRPVGSDGRAAINERRSSGASSIGGALLSPRALRTLACRQTSRSASGSPPQEKRGKAADTLSPRRHLVATRGVTACGVAGTSTLRPLLVDRCREQQDHRPAGAQCSTRWTTRRRQRRPRPLALRTHARRLVAATTSDASLFSGCLHSSPCQLCSSRLPRAWALCTGWQERVVAATRRRALVRKGSGRRTARRRLVVHLVEHWGQRAGWSSARDTLVTRATQGDGAGYFTTPGTSRGRHKVRWGSTWSARPAPSSPWGGEPLACGDVCCTAECESRKEEEEELADPSWRPDDLPAHRVAARPCFPPGRRRRLRLLLRYDSRAPPSSPASRDAALFDLAPPRTGRLWSSSHQGERLATRSAWRRPHRRRLDHGPGLPPRPDGRAQALVARVLWYETAALDPTVVIVRDPPATNTTTSSSPPTPP